MLNCPYKYFFRRIKMEVFLVIVAIVVFGVLVYKFVSIKQEETATYTAPEAAPYKVEPTEQSILPVVPKKVANLEVVSTTNSVECKPRTTAKKGKTPSMAKAEVSIKKASKTPSTVTKAPAKTSKNKPGNK